MLIHFQEGRAYNPDTNKLVGIINNSKATIAIQDVNNIPVHCMAFRTRNDCLIYENEKNFKIKINDEKARTIRSDFKKATHALVIFEPHKFINYLSKSYDIVAEPIKYFDYSFNTLQMFSYIMGNQSIMPNI